MPEFELNCSFLLPINPIALTSFYLDCTVYFLLHFSLNECVSASTQVLANLESRFFINFHLRKKSFEFPLETLLFRVLLIISLKREYFLKEYSFLIYLFLNTADLIIEMILETGSFHSKWPQLHQRFLCSNQWLLYSKLRLVHSSINCSYL